MHPLLHGVTRQAINHQLGRNGAGDDADALTYAEDTEQAEHFRRQAAECTNRLSLERIKRDRYPGVRDDGNAQGNKNATNQGAHQIDEHTADGHDEYRHGLTPCDDAQREKEGHRKQDIAERGEVRIDHGKRQSNCLTPHRHIEVRNTRRTSAQRIA